LDLARHQHLLLQHFYTNLSHSHANYIFILRNKTSTISPNKVTTSLLYFEWKWISIRDNLRIFCRLLFLQLLLLAGFGAAVRGLSFVVAGLAASDSLCFFVGSFVGFGQEKSYGR
jgi:hypothetical protein